MNQGQRIEYLINYLQKKETYDFYKKTPIPNNYENQKSLLRALMNVREPYDVDDCFIKIQDEYLKQRNKERGITYIDDLYPIVENIYLWKGDITTLKCDAIVNAANSGLTGCYIPNHSCIDNCIHTFAGVQLRNKCRDIIYKQGHYEETGKAKITSAYNLPSKYILHTVGPIINNEVREEDKILLKSCYESCLNIAIENDIKSIAFCCISTGEFHFPNKEAARIAIDTVNEYKTNNNLDMKIIFNVFKDEDNLIYERLLKRNK